MDSPVTHPIPTSEELKAELLSMPEPPEKPEPITEPGFEELVAVALRHVRGRRGGDLVSVILVGSSVRRAITTHSDIDLIALVKGQADGHEIVRVADRLADIRYRGHQELEEDLPYRRASRLSYGKPVSSSITMTSAPNSLNAPTNGFDRDRPLSASMSRFG